MKNATQTKHELDQEIDSFQPVTTPCKGSQYPWIHRPERIIDGVSRTPGIRCGCGKVFEGKSWQAPSNQPAPALWSAFQNFKAHVSTLSNGPESPVAPQVLGPVVLTGKIFGHETRVELPAPIRIPTPAELDAMFSDEDNYERGDFERYRNQEGR